MNLLEIAEEFGLKPRKTASSRGGEYHSPCPVCGGHDRFVIWPQVDQYWCRQCKASGDGIQFCRDYLGLDFQSACRRAGATPRPMRELHRPSKPRFQPVLVSAPSETWVKKAGEFAVQCHQQLLGCQAACELLFKRGLSLESIKTFSLGWNAHAQYPKFSDWGLPADVNEEGREKKVSLPRGLVIPVFSSGKIVKLKIRCTDWNQGSKFQKYAEVPGNTKAPAFYGSRDAEIAVIVEAEFDAMILMQEVRNHYAYLALGGAQKRPDLATHEWLLSRKLILFALDFDEGGKGEYEWWQSTYSHLQPWPVPEEKSPGDYFVHGGNLKQWLTQWNGN